ncbi:hypothetical protein EJ110_NYTH50319 [Nymphaea thermarum]|nr:hypothetical protein EJ110_NYTH50319 [Nymphaea thermarum]
MNPIGVRGGGGTRSEKRGILVMIQFARTMAGNYLIDQLKWKVSLNNKEVRQLFHQMILSMFPISSRETSGIVLCNMAIPPRSLR